MFYQEVGFGFDLEGTTVDLETLHQKAFDEVITSYGLGLRFTHADIVLFSGKGDRVISDFLSGEIRRLDPNLQTTADQIRARKSEIYRQMLYGYPIQPRPGVLEYIGEARRLTNNLVIASLTIYEDAMHIIKAAGLDQVFEHILTEKSVTHLKPDPEVYLLGASTLGVLPARLLVHEDSPTGVQAAVSAGCPVLAFPVLPVTFDPKPSEIFDGWIGLNPRELVEKYVVR